MKSTFTLTALLALALTATAFAQDRPRFERPNLKPTLFANLGDECYTPDGMTVSDETGLLYLNVPNFGRMDENMVKADSAQGGYLYEVDKDGKATRILEYPILERTGQAGPMGLDFGPDGNLYVCDNQYFHNKDYCSRILRVVFKDGKPTTEVQVVVEGIKLANGMAWYKDKLFYTDSCFDEDPDEANGVIGSGGVFGKGLGNSVQKLGFVPEAENDMIFSIICEELGLFGAVCVILLFLFMLYRFLVIANNAPDLLGSMLVVGVMAQIALQVFLNIAVVTNFIPNTGVSLPLISYGGTSLVFLMAEIGMALGVSRKIRLD